jgi:hypothetical protein
MKLKLRRSGLYECTQCHWYFVKTGRQWRGALWHEPLESGGITKYVNGYFSRIELGEYPDCIQNLQRVK